MLQETIRNDGLSASQHSNVGTMLQPFETMSQQCLMLRCVNRRTVANRPV